MFIITNSTLGDEYTPSVTKTLKEARDFLKETTIKNFKDGYENYLAEEFSVDDVDDISEKDIIREINDICGCYLREDSSCITYDDESYNLMHIYDTNEIEVKTFENHLDAFSFYETEFRLNSLVESGKITGEKSKDVFDAVYHDIKEFFYYNSSAVNYDGLDDIICNNLEEE